jgi:hypothetical protein
MTLRSREWRRRRDQRAEIGIDGATMWDGRASDQV